MPFLLLAHSMNISKLLSQNQPNSQHRRCSPRRGSKLSALLREWAAGQRVRLGLLDFQNCFNQLYWGIIYMYVSDTDCMCVCVSVQQNEPI